MTVIRRTLSENIAHVEDLPIDEFIDALKNMPSMIAQEKLDGSNLWLGLDEDGRFFTSREGKRANSERRYTPEEWPLISVFNQFRAAAAALQEREADIKRVMRAGDTVEAEVLFGRQPNSVTYGADGKSYIAFLRGVSGTPDSIAEHLGTTLANQQVDAKVDIVDTTDGETLSVLNQSFPFQFTTPQRIDPEKLKAASDVDKHLVKLETFLRAKSPVAGMTNKELMAVQLTQIPKDDRAEIKQARADVLAKVQTEYKLPIKQALLDKVVRQIRSGLSDKELGDEEDIGIEGIVLRDPHTGKQIKVVDKDIFSTINRFNQSVRGQIQSSLTTVNPDASLESRGGIVGELRIRIADLLGNRDLAKGANIRKVLTPIKGASPEETIKNFAGTMVGVNDYQAIKKKVLALTSETAIELQAKLDDFKENDKNYRLKLKNGKEMGLSKDTIKKTLLSFAEARKNLTDMFNKIKSTGTLAQLLAILYGAQARAVHEPKDDEITEGVLFEGANGEIDQADYAMKDLFTIVNSYIATVYLTMLMYNEDDAMGLRRVRDRKNYMMKTWARDMSPMNHWGYVIWRNTRPDLKKLVPKKVLADLQTATRHIQSPHWKFMHMQFSADKKLHVNWADHRTTIQRLIDLTGLRSDRLNTLLDEMIRWPELSYDEKIKSLGRLYMYSQQFMSRSSLFNRLKVIQSNMLLNATGKNPEMVEGLLKKIAALSEDDGADAGIPAGATVSTATATTASAIGSVPSRIGGLAMIIKRKRNPAVKMIMKFPDTRKT